MRSDATVTVTVTVWVRVRCRVRVRVRVTAGVGKLHEERVRTMSLHHEHAPHEPAP